MATPLEFDFAAEVQWANSTIVELRTRRDGHQAIGLSWASGQPDRLTRDFARRGLTCLSYVRGSAAVPDLGTADAFDRNIARIRAHVEDRRARELEAVDEIVALLERSRARNLAVGLSWPAGQPDRVAHFFAARGLEVAHYVRGQVEVGEPSAYADNLARLRAHRHEVAAAEVEGPRERGARIDVGFGQVARLRADGRIDVCYLSYPSRWGEELRYSLRSLARYFAQVGDVWIVGHLPDYIDPAAVIHVPYSHPIEPEIEPLKRLYVNAQPELSEDYVHFNDDFVLLRPVEAADFKPYIVQDLNAVRQRGTGRWQRMLWKTFDAVRQRGGHGYNFETHTPKIYNRARFVMVMQRYRDLWARARHRYDALCCDTAYFNTVLTPGATPPPVGPVCAGLAHAVVDDAKLEALVRDKTFLFYDDTGLTPALERLLLRRFPEPCVYETSAAKASRTRPGQRAVDRAHLQTATP